MEGRQGPGMSVARRLDITGEALLTRPRAMEHEEAQALVRLALASGAGQVTVGHGRDPVSRDNARMFVRAWQQEGGQVLGVVSWPEVAASWLRQARRLTVPEPDLWVMGGPPAGFSQVVHRLTCSTSWSPQRTLAWGPESVAVSLLLVGPQALEGVRGVDGVEAWVVHGGVMRGAQTPGVHAGPPTRRGREARVVDARWDQ